MPKIKAYAKMLTRKVITIYQLIRNSMENYFIDRDTLEQVVNPLIAQKYPNQSDEAVKDIRDEQIRKLDDAILDALYGNLDEAQSAEVEALFDHEEENPDAFKAFFEKAGIDVEQVMKDTIEKFSQEFLGGQNA